MTSWTWPDLEAAPQAFYSQSLAPTQALWSAWRISGSVGSGRPAGPRNWQWSAAIVLAVAALEAGLEELLLAGHARRAGTEGDPIPRREREHLVESVLQAPNSGKIERALFSAFGIRIGAVALSATSSFTARRKELAHAGSGRGSVAASPTTWRDLAAWLDAVVFIRHAIAHGDIAKHSSYPQSAEGLLWVRLRNGGWSVQQPHALTALRTVVATYNATAVALEGAFGSPRTAKLRLADDLFKYTP